MTLELHNTENPISNTERLKINENWQRIISGYSYLQQQIKVLAGGAEVDELIQRLNEAVDSANVAVQQAIDANNTATQEAIEANNTALQDALTTVSQTLVDVNKAITNANTATTEANTAKQGALDATAQAQTALDAMQSLITNLGSKGVWNDTTQYYKNNLAVFNGSTFIALQDNLGKTPPTLPTQTNAYWSLFAEKGATGNTGLQGPPGKDGTGVTIIGSLPSETDLPPVGAPGDAYMIEGNLYVWQDNTKTWKNVGPIQGPEGKSAYDLAVKNGFQGTMEEWIESLKGEQGPPGPMGPPGPPADLTEINQQVSTLQTEVTGIASSLVTINEVKPFSGDLNDLSETGIYQFPAFTTNAPTSSGALVEVIASLDAINVIQKVTVLSNKNNVLVLKRTGYKNSEKYEWSVETGAGQINGWRVENVGLIDNFSSTSTTQAATANTVRELYARLAGERIDIGANSYAGTTPTLRAISIGVNSQALNRMAIAMGVNAFAGNDDAISIGSSSIAKGVSSVAVGDRAQAQGKFAIALGILATAGGESSLAIGNQVSSPNPKVGILGSNSSGFAPSTWQVPGNFSVAGTKNFEIPHPHPDKKDTHIIRHGAVESPTAGDTLYRYTIEALKDGETVEVQLPDYFEHLNTNVDVWVNPDEHFGRAFGKVLGDKLLITCEKVGKYKALVIGTRNDDNVQDWYVKGVEREIGESWQGETYIFEVEEISEVAEFEEVTQ